MLTADDCTRALARLIHNALMGVDSLDCAPVDHGPQPLRDVAHGAADGGGAGGVGDGVGVRDLAADGSAERPGVVGCGSRPQVAQGLLGR